MSNAAAVPGKGRSDGFNRLMITASIMTATLMNALDMTIANVALPHIQGSVSASQDQITWVLTSYIVAAAIMTPLSGALTSRFGQKRVFLAAVAGFTVASALCGLAQNLLEIVGFRLLQGVCGAPLIPLAQAVLLDINPPNKQGQAMAVWGMASMVGPIMGPVLGGYLTDHFSWRWVFFINLPFGVASFLGIMAFIKDERPKASRKFDAMGFGFLAVAVGALQLMLDRGQGQDWLNSGEIWIEAFVALVALYLCIIQTITSPQPFINRALLADVNFITASLFGLLVGVLMFSTTALLPPMIETLLGYPVTQAGLVLAPRGFGTLFSMFVVGRLVGRVDSRLIILIGLLILSVSLYQMTHFSLTMPAGPIILSGVLQGMGTGLLFVPLSALAFSTLPTAMRTEAAGIFTLLRSLGSSVGISIISAVQVQAMVAAHADLNSNIRPGNPILSTMARPIDLNNLASLAAINGEISRQAAMIAYIDAFKMIMIICFVALPLLVFMRQPKRRLAEETIHAAVE